MANTYTKIAASNLAASAATITFSSIPSSYANLNLRFSVRTDYGASRTGFRVTFNGSSAANYYETYFLQYDSTSIAGGESLGATYNVAEYIDGTGATTNAFGSGEIYIPNYSGSLAKGYIGFAGAESNSSTATGMYAKQYLWNQTAVISSITLTANTGNFVSGTSVYLYGIKSS